MSYLAWSQQVTKWLYTTCIKTRKPDALTLSQKSISRLSSAADFWTFIKGLCLSSSMVGTCSGWAGSKLYPGFGPLHSCSECASSAHKSHSPEKRDPSPHPHTYHCIGPGASLQPKFHRLMIAQEVRIKQACTSFWQTWALLWQHLARTALGYSHSPLHPHESEFSLVHIHPLVSPQEFFSFFSLRACLLLPPVVRRGEEHFQGSGCLTYAHVTCWMDWVSFWRLLFLPTYHILTACLIYCREKLGKTKIKIHVPTADVWVPSRTLNAIKIFRNVQKNVQSQCRNCFRSLYQAENFAIVFHSVLCCILSPWNSEEASF